jgi:anaerobic ribonucleoside-triphosphate reductase activating protein
MKVNNFSATWLDYPDTESLAIVVYFEGCSHNCSGCHNPELQKYGAGMDYTPYQLLHYTMGLSEMYRTRKLVFSGGDPLYEENRDDVKEFLRINKYFDVCVYTGYEIEQVREFGISEFEFIKCGKFVRELKDEHSGKGSKRFVLASKNQRLYNKDLTQISEDNIFNFKD